MPWVDGGVSSYDQRNLKRLTTLARVSPQTFEEVIDRPWVRQNRDDRHYEEPQVIRYLIGIALRDESVALQVAKLPFLDTIEWGDSDNVAFLLGLLDSDPEGLQKLLSHPELQARNAEGPPKPIPSLYLETRNAAAADSISSLEWVQDGLEENENQTVTLLQQMAMESPNLFRAVLKGEREWMPAQTGMDLSTIRRLIFMAETAEPAALAIIDMPFMETIEVSDGDAIRLLANLSRTDPKAVESILSHPSFGDGIRDEQAADVSLLYLEQTDLEAARLLMELEWVRDGIYYQAPKWTVNLWGQRSQVGSAKDPIARFESSVLLDLVDLSEKNRPMFLVLVTRPWLQGELNQEGFEAFSSLRDMASRYPREASQIIHMPFLDDLERGDDATLEMLFDLLKRDRNAFAELISHPELEGGITEEDRFTAQWLYIEILFPESAAAIGDLPWVQDGLTDNEQLYVLHFKEFAATSELVLLKLLNKPWVRDGLGEYEFSLVLDLKGISQERYAFDYRPMALEMVSMPFLDSVEPSDVAATEALSQIQSWGNLGPRAEDIMSHPALQDGITDREATIVAFMHGALHYNLDLNVDRLELLDTLLDPEKSTLETRIVTLPRAGEVTLAVIQTSPRALTTLDLLEEVFRIQEDYLRQPLQRYFAGLLQANVLAEGDSTVRGGIIIANDRITAESFPAIAHWAAYYHWGSSQSWLTDGGIEVIRKETERIAGRPVSNRIGVCTLVSNIQELVKLEAKQSEKYDEELAETLSRSNCGFILGGGLFEELQSNLTPKDFQRKLINLDQDLSNSTYARQCTGLEEGLCYVKKVFVDEATPTDAAIAEEIIDRWYYGNPLEKN